MTIFKSSKTGYRTGLIGYGAIGQEIARAINSGKAGRCSLHAVLRQQSTMEKPEFLLTNDPVEFFQQSFDLVIEAAGQDAVRQYAVNVLDSGTDLLLTSMGVFADDDLMQALVLAANNSGARIMLCSGALPAVDWMSAVSAESNARVTITQEKPVVSWRNTPAEELIDMEILAKPGCFFEGTARESASLFPKSSNITAMLALATVGLDSTRVRLVANPESFKMRTDISFKSALGDLDVTWHGIPSDINPRTSEDVAHTVIKALRNLTSTLIIGV